MSPECSVEVRVTLNLYNSDSFLGYPCNPASRGATRALLYSERRERDLPRYSEQAPSSAEELWKSESIKGSTSALYTS